ncbi:MAG: site-specific integrase, partial [Syntrophobacteraceae bacterium]|nr:site-specific integrase [Syntrophobacteraceae bacterium]
KAPPTIGEWRAFFARFCHLIALYRNSESEAGTFVRRLEDEMDALFLFLTYAAARLVVKKPGKPAGIELRPHDLRRHAATYASWSGVPIEIVSKVILRHANLSTTQRYLGKISDTEATRWIENLYG